MKLLMRNLCCALLLFVPALLSAQLQEPEIPKDWYLRDPEQDRLQGISIDKAYALLKDRPSRTVVVAIIDSGIDINHEDLKNVIWTNDDEIPGNGIDDDKNGYIDDVHGWNFIGGKDGNVDEDTYELTREYMRLKKKFEDSETKIPKKQKTEYESYKKIKDKFKKLKAKNEQQYDLYKNMYFNVALSADTLEKILKPDSLTTKSLSAYSPTDPTLIFAKSIVLNMVKNMETDESIKSIIGQLKDAYDYYRVIVEYGYSEEYDSRKIIGDHYENIYEKGYGNNDVIGLDALHGTHVAGIIAADRKNEVGIKGIADNVKIMPVRTVPNGDERDKDIANAIIYAVDNGANIINMSFGKDFSPEKEAVDRAVKYAEQKGVLLVHAAGNDGQNADVAKNYPIRSYLDGTDAKNWLEVGASSTGLDNELVASFSNFGKKQVDFFAPGEDIYSTIPGNHYKDESGTSMASPVVSGIAALLMSYFPELTALEIKQVLRNSTRKFDGLEIQKPGGGKAHFSNLSNTGGLVNAYEAVKMAEAMTKQRIIMNK